MANSERVEIHGTVRGNVIELDVPLTLPTGQRVRVVLEPETAQPDLREERAAAWSRVLEHLETGYDLGGAPYPRREDLYDRSKP